jgi:YgiT-type zinc finger domain-containing protein
MKPDFVQCLNCRIGTLRRGKATYTQWIGDELVLVPDVSAWQCDVCGDFAYEEDVLARVELLLGSQFEHSKPKKNAPQDQTGPASNKGALSDG